LIDARHEYFFFDFLDGFRGCVWVFAPVDLEPVLG
jgi:hypothetical protein